MKMETKGYCPQPADTSDVVLPDEIVELTELIAENAHDDWALQRIKEGWTYGKERNDSEKKHPCLVPYSGPGGLPESEKEYDRKTAVGALKLIVKLGYKISKA